MSAPKKTSRSAFNYICNNCNDQERPIIKKCSWGNVVVSYLSETDTFKDVIIWPDGFKTWDWSLSNTHHTPGIQKPEVKFLVNDCGCDYIILSQGFENVLKVDKQTKDWLNEKHIEYAILSSTAAIHEYNNTSNKKIGILLHTTC